MKREFSAGGIVFFRENKRILYLLLHYQGGYFDFPKGHIEKGETPYEAAAREITEETGVLKLEPVFGFKKELNYFFKWRGALRFKKVIFYLFEAKSKNVRVSREHIGFKILPYKEAYDTLTYKNSKEILKSANKFLLSAKFSKSQELYNNVYDLTKKIPRGRVATYGQIACALGNKNLSRVVGNILNKNCFKDVPCHRVVMSDGNIGGFNKGAAKKEKMLASENIIVKNKKTNLKKFLFKF